VATEIGYRLLCRHLSGETTYDNEQS
jgi:hypothetical protein